MRPVLALLIVAGMLHAGCGHRIPPPSPGMWLLRGVVLSVTDTAIRVRHKNGEVVEVQLDDRTSFVKNRQPASAQSLRPRILVIVDVETVQRGIYRARLVRMF